MNLTVLRMKDITAKRKRCKASIYTEMDAGTFPPSISIGARAVGWFENEVDAVILARAAGGSDEEIRKLVKQLVAVRKDLKAKLAAEAA